MKENGNDGVLNTTSIEIKEHPIFIKIFPEVPSKFPCDLEDIPDIPSHVIYDLELMDCLQMEEFCKDFTMTKFKVRSKEEEVTIEPRTKARFDPARKPEIEIRLHNICQDKVEEPTWEKHLYAYLKWDKIGNQWNP